MSVEKMELATVSGSFEKLDETLDLFRDAGCFHPENMSLISGASRLSEDNPYKAQLDRLNGLIKSAGITVPEGEYDDLPLSGEQARAQVDKIEKDISGFQKELAMIEKEQEYCKSCIHILRHFETIDIPINDFFETEFVSVRFGRLPLEGYKMLVAYADNPDVIFYPFSHDNDYYWGMYIVPAEYAAEVDKIFSGLLFEKIYIPGAVDSPSEAIELLNEQLAEDAERAEQTKADFKAYFENRTESIQSFYSKLCMLNTRFELRNYVSRHGDHFVMMGWVPKPDAQRLTELFDGKDGITVSFNENKNISKLSPPIKLKNTVLHRPFEFYIKMFGMPKYGEIDPTAFVAITYTLLFGIMFADFGQGLVLSIVGYFMYKLKKMELGKLLIPCGIAGSFFGLVFGSCFGFEEIFNSLYYKLGLVSSPEHKPIEIMSNIMTILYSAVGIGVVLMLLALILNIYSKFKQREIGEALFSENGLCGLLFYAGAITLAANAVLSLNIPTLPIVLAGIVIPIACIWLKDPLIKLCDGEEDWKPESWGGYMTQGFFELFEASLSYVTNTVSFLRVGAFVLVHAGMMSVFFSLANMFGEYSVGFWIVVVFGNIFVLVLEGLLVGVQSLRLEFYEMFNRFFEGSGHEFKPIKY